MAETHELRLKIDAAAAKRGSREFAAAINAVKLAVRDLERDSTGAFTQLRKNLDTLSKKGKVKIGIDQQSIRDLNAFAKAQQQIVNSTASSTKGIKTLIQTMRGLSDSYAAARTTSEAFAASILKANSALNRQIQLASQARSAVRQTRSAPVATTSADPVATAAAKQSVRDLDKELARLRASAASASTALGKAFREAGAASAKAAGDTRTYNSQLSRMEGLQLSTAAAIRRSEQEAVRLSSRLKQIGDTKGATAINQALITLKARLAGGVGSALELRRAMDQFARSTSTAHITITRFGAAQASAAAQARRLAAANKESADSARRVEREMRSIAGASNAASAAMRNATGNMRGLENAFSATFQAGSLFRTMLGSITFGTFISNVFSAGDALDQFRVTMEVASGSASAAMGEMDFIDEAAARLGVNLLSARDNYSKFAISADIAGVSANSTKKIFESVSTAMAVLGKSTEDQNLAFLALEQMMSKGKVSSEELRRQLGERLPGAVNLMAQALKVTTGELQDLLKAGAIDSADALPKFADVLMERFGPGMEQAAKRAGNNLQKLRNEITKFLETVAQSGFMQELAVQFRELTDQLASGAGANAARNLGEALANAARIGGEAVQWLVENLDGVGRAIKAIGVGIIVRQILLMGTAIATTSQQLAGYAAAWLNGGRATTAAEMAVQKHTLALQANTAALVGNNTASKASIGGTVAAGRAQEVAARRALTTRTSFLSLGAASGILGGAMTATATRAAGFSRVLGAIAPIVGIAVTAILLIPGAMDAVGLGSDKMALKVNAALARTGVAFEEFGEIVRNTASQTQMTQLVSDIELLSQAAQGLDLGGGLFGLGLSDIGALATTIADANEELGFMESIGAKAGRTLSGMAQVDTSSLSKGARLASKELLDQLISVRQGQGSAIDLQKDFNDAMGKYPSLAPLREEFATLINQQLQFEAGIAANKDKLTNLFGTQDEKLVKVFADQAKQVLRTGEGFEELKAQQQALMKDTPQLGGILKAVMRDFKDAFSTGASPLEFSQDVQRFYGGTAEEFIRLREEVVNTERALDDSLNNLQSKVSDSLKAFTEGGFDTDAISKFQTEFAKFAEFQAGEGLRVSAEAVKEFGNSLSIATPAAATFKNEVVAQFAALSAGQQTYTNLDNILRQYAAKYPAAAAEVANLSDKMRENARAGNENASSVSDLEDIVSQLPPEMQAGARAALALASGVQVAGTAADGATGNLNGAADAAAAAASAAANATNMVNGLAGALANLAGVDIGGMASSMIEKINRATILKGLAPAQRKAKSFEFEAQDAISKAFKKDTEGLDPRTDAGLFNDAARARDAKLAEVRALASRVESAAQNEENTVAYKAPKAGGSGGGGKGRKEALSDEQKAVEKLNESLQDRLRGLLEERLALQMVADGQFETMDAAKLAAEAQLAHADFSDLSTNAMLRQIDAASKLNEELKTLANDPVKEWMKSVPNWIEAGQQIEMGAINSIKDSLSEFIKTGTFDLEALGESILGVVADIVADKAVAELANLLGRGEKDSKGLGGILGSLFGSQGDDVTGPTMGSGQDVASGGLQAGQSISQAMVQAGTQVSQSISAAMMQGGNSAATAQGAAITQGGASAATSQRVAGAQNAAQISTATTTSGTQHATQVKGAIDSGAATHASMIRGAAAGTPGGGSSGGGFLSGIFGGIFGGGGADAGSGGGGGGGGGMFSTIASLALGAFKEGGYSTSPVGSAMMPASAFRHAPHFAQGTPNTSGIPAVLHDNEAVIPLSKGRKIPVDMGGAAAGQGGSQTVNQTFNINTPDADSFRRSQKQLTADGASAAQRAMSSNR